MRVHLNKPASRATELQMLQLLVQWDANTKLLGLIAGSQMARKDIGI